jgi:hypothetical protein
MTTAKLTVAEDDLSKACAKVGRFLHEFALVEQEINNSIVQILDLKGDAADVVANSIDFFRKANLLQTVALETAPEPEKNSIGKLFSAVAKRNDDRNVMAHSVFEPAADEGVQFRRTVAKDGRVKKSDPLWTKQDFENSYKSLHDIREKLTKLSPMLTLSINEDRRTRIFHHYLYTPASSWVPVPPTRAILGLLSEEEARNFSRLDSRLNKDSTITTKEKPAKSNS